MSLFDRTNDFISIFQLDDSGNSTKLHVFIDYNLELPKLRKFLQG